MNDSTERNDIDPKTAAHSAGDEKPQRSDQPLKRVNDDDDDQKQPDKEHRDPKEKQQKGTKVPPYPTGRQPIPR